MANQTDFPPNGEPRQVMLGELPSRFDLFYGIAPCKPDMIGRLNEDTGLWDVFVRQADGSMKLAYSYAISEDED